MTRHVYPRSLAKYIRRQKQRIRRQNPNQEEAIKRIAEFLASLNYSR